ncbi:replication-relaxation family protein [Kitasatospora azatica]|uniref:replication-relaxation family protein n=1 Tax=Kitasatospora azatica TaxID=58347 RepID=UPI00068B6B92|nr:replication-relaxation family protein [Kitasatospora azatica]
MHPTAPARQRTTTTAARHRPALAVLARRLTPRDIWLLEMLQEHTVLTSTHLTDLLTTSRRSVNRRLATLTDLSVLHSFRPHHRPGSAPEHYVLGPAGANLLAARYATTPAALGWHPEQATRTMFSPFLAHDLGARTFFTHLTRPTRPREQLTAWWSEQRCEHLWADLAHPDGYGHYKGLSGAVSFFLEYDTGTEALTRLARKLDDYAELATTTRTRPLILFTLHSGARETNLHDRLTGHPALEHLAVATTSRDQHHPATGHHHPADPLWLPVSHPGIRTRLADLPTAWPIHQRPGTATATADQDTGDRSDGRRRIPAPTPTPPAHAAPTARPPGGN